MGVQDQVLALARQAATGEAQGKPRALDHYLAVLRGRLALHPGDEVEATLLLRWLEEALSGEAGAWTKDWVSLGSGPARAVLEQQLEDWCDMVGLAQLHHVIELNPSGVAWENTNVSDFLRGVATSLGGVELEARLSWAQVGRLLMAGQTALLQD